MPCNNRVSYYVPRGYDYREVAVRSATRAEATPAR